MDISNFIVIMNDFIRFFNSFLKYYGNSKKKEEEYNNGYISIEKICSLNKIEVILQETQKKIFEILTIFGKN